MRRGDTVRTFFAVCIFYMYFHACGVTGVRGCACQLFIKRIYDDDDAMLLYIAILTPPTRRSRSAWHLSPESRG